LFFYACSVIVLQLSYWKDNSVIKEILSYNYHKENTSALSTVVKEVLIWDYKYKNSNMNYFHHSWCISIADHLRENSRLFILYDNMTHSSRQFPENQHKKSNCLHVLTCSKRQLWWPSERFGTRFQCVSNQKDLTVIWRTFSIQ